MDPNINNGFYERYVYQYAKRFYTPFKKENIHKVINFIHTDKMDYVQCVDENNELYEWDVEDCVFVTNEKPMIDDNRVANINHPEYNGYNPFEIN